MAATFDLTLPSTINVTSFAVAFGDATALMLDATTLIGSSRKEKLSQAEGRLNDALKYTDMTEERVMALSLLSAITRMRNLALDI